MQLAKIRKILKILTSLTRSHETRSRKAAANSVYYNSKNEKLGEKI